jgi:segregation and condensation protein B
MHPNTPDEPEPSPAEEAARSRAAAVGGQTWQLDVESADPGTESEDRRVQPGGPSEEPDEPPGPPRRSAQQPPPAEEPPPSPVRIVEALLFVGGSPLRAERACGVVRGLTPEQFREAVDALNRDYRRQGRPYLVQGGEAGYSLVLRPRYRAVREKLFGVPREVRLSQAAVEVLSVVAYRQPVGKPEVDTQRGADSGSLLRQLVRLGLAAVAQRGEGKERESVYVTTARFLELFGLRSLDDLPQTGDLQRL